MIPSPAMQAPLCSLSHNRYPTDPMAALETGTVILVARYGPGVEQFFLRGGRQGRDHGSLGLLTARCACWRKSIRGAWRTRCSFATRSAYLSQGPRRMRVARWQAICHLGHRGMGAPHVTGSSRTVRNRTTPSESGCVVRPGPCADIIASSDRLLDQAQNGWEVAGRCSALPPHSGPE